MAVCCVLMLALRFFFVAFTGNIVAMAAMAAMLFFFGAGGAFVLAALLHPDDIDRGPRLVAVAVLVLGGLSLYWVEQIGEFVFEERQRARIEYYERKRVELRPPSGTGEVIVEEGAFSVVLFDEAQGHVVFLLSDARRRLVVWFKDPTGPRARRFDHVHLKHLEGHWYWGRPFK